ncbi:unnamed protein product [Sphagnum balticum]
MDDEMIDNVRREVDCMAMLNHENIIELFGVATNNEKLCLVLEYAENGSLEHLMSKFKIDVLFLNDTYALIGGSRGQVHVLEQDTLNIIRPLDNRSSDQIMCIEYCSALDMVITGSGDTTARMWNAATGKCERVFRGHYGATGKCLVLQGHTLAVRCVAFDGNTIVSGSRNEEVRIWHAPFNTNDCKRVLNKHDDVVYRLWLCPTLNQHIVVSVNPNRIYLHDIHTGAPVCEPINYKFIMFDKLGHALPSCAKHIAVVGDRLVFVNESSNVEVRDVNNAGQAEHTIKCNSDIISEIRLMSPVPDHPDLLVTGGADGDVHLWNIKTEFQIEALFLNDTHALIGGSHGEVCVLEQDTLDVIRQLNGHTMTIECIELVTGSHDYTVRVWNVQTGECVHTLDGHTDTVWCVAFDGITIASGSHDTAVHIWQAPYSAENCKRLYGHDGPVHRVWLCPAPNQHIVVSADEVKIYLHDINTGERVCEPINYMIYDIVGHTRRSWPSCASNMTVIGDRLVFINGSGNVAVRRVHNVDLVERTIYRNGDIVSKNSHMSPVPDHPDLLVTAGEDGDVHLWDIKTGAHIKLMQK